MPHEAVSRSTERPNTLPFPVDPVTVSFYLEVFFIKFRIYFVFFSGKDGIDPKQQLEDRKKALWHDTTHRRLVQVTLQLLPNLFRYDFLDLRICLQASFMVRIRFFHCWHSSLFFSFSSALHWCSSFFWFCISVLGEDVVVSVTRGLGTCLIPPPGGRHQC